MSKSRGASMFGRASTPRSGHRRGGTVTIIEDRVSRSYARTAKIAFYIITVVVGLLAATIATAFPEYVRHPVIALFIGLIVGVAVAAPVAGIIAAWPVIRALWWWLPEILIALTVLYGFVLLCQHTPLPVRLAVVMAVLAPLAVPNIRQYVTKIAYCFIVRHRIRTCFADFLIGNNRGSLPLILWAKPTPVGEDVWVWLRPGLSLSELQTSLEKIAVTCWAASVTVELAGKQTNAAYVRLHVKRRDALTGTVVPTLVQDPALADAVANGEHSTRQMSPDDLPATDAGLDLDDVTAEQVSDPPKTNGKTNTKPADSNGGARKKPVTQPATVPAADDDPYADYR
ncbi:hypothetical protein [Actinomadura sp. 6N118]|uniref:hypothetical protein n=1 Tax=Actinomadura sp. 6N118 TaxID=3375151 RepID=UPI0037B8A9EE